MENNWKEALKKSEEDLKRGEDNLLMLTTAIEILKDSIRFIKTKIGK